MKKCNYDRCKNQIDKSKVYCSRKCSMLGNKSIHGATKLLYTTNPSKCIKCNINMDFKHRHTKCCKQCRATIAQKFNCPICNALIKRGPAVVNKSKSGNQFCSRSCAATYNNRQRRKSHRSKIEIKFFDMLKSKFPNLDIIPNDKTMLDGLEVDIAIPSLHLAIEWNGIIHFKPIYGQEKLFATQQRDAEKLKLATNKNINLIVISDHVSNQQIVDESFNQICTLIKSIQSTI